MAGLIDDLKIAGQKSPIPSTVEKIIDAEVKVQRVGNKIRFNTGNNQYIITKTKKQGYGYFTLADFLDSEDTKLTNLLERRYKTKIWDGTKKGLQTLTFPVEKAKVVEEVAETEDQPAEEAAGESQ